MTTLAVQSSSYVPDKLIAGCCDVDRFGKSITIKSGQGTLVRGTLLGAVLRALGATTPGANTGNGTVTGAALKAATKVGNYTLTCVAVAANGGTFSVVDPDGVRIADAKVGVAYNTRQIGFTINDGATDFVLNDSFTIAVAAGSGKFVMVDDASVDGSSDKAAGDFVILADDADTTADVAAPAYQAGTFNKAAVFVAAGTNVSDYVLALQGRNIYLRDVGVVNVGV
jgi:hypothetical protein